MAGKAAKNDVNPNGLKEPDYAEMIKRLDAGDAPEGEESPADNATPEAQDADTDSRGLAKTKVDVVVETSDTSPENAGIQKGKKLKPIEEPDAEPEEATAETPAAPVAKAPKAETPPPPPPAAAAEEELELVVDGLVTRQKKSDVIRLAQMGVDYGRKSQAIKARETELLQKADDLDKLLQKLGPHKAKLDALIAEEKEKEANDPSFGAVREAREAKANLVKLEQRLESEKAQVQQQAAIANLNSRLDAEEGRYPEIASRKADPEAAAMIRAEVYRRVGHLGIPIEQAVAGVAKLFGGSGVPAPVNAGPQSGAAYAKAKLADARRSPVPGKGAPSSSPAKKKFTMADVKDGTMDRAIAAYLKTVDAP